LRSRSAVCEDNRYAAIGVRRGTKKLPKVRTEMSLQLLAYNLWRVRNVVGSSALPEALRGSQAHVGFLYLVSPGYRR
jgi:hypothetical protein